MNLTTKRLQKRISQYPLNLFQFDLTYKLMREGFPTFVYGTSNIIHEFYPAGICIASNEDAETFAGVFKNVDGDNVKEMMGDGDNGLSKAHKEVWQGDAYFLKKQFLGDRDDDDHDDDEYDDDDYKEVNFMIIIKV